MLKAAASWNLLEAPSWNLLEAAPSWNLLEAAHDRKTRRNTATLVLRSCARSSFRLHPQMPCKGCNGGRIVNNPKRLRTRKALTTLLYVCSCLTRSQSKRAGDLQGGLRLCALAVGCLDAVSPVFGRPYADRAFTRLCIDAVCSPHRHLRLCVLAVGCLDAASSVFGRLYADRAALSGSSRQPRIATVVVAWLKSMSPFPFSLSI